jgi:hypothetical protein
LQFVKHLWVANSFHITISAPELHGSFCIPFKMTPGVAPIPSTNSFIQQHHTISQQYPLVTSPLLGHAASAREKLQPYARHIEEKVLASLYHTPDRGANRGVIDKNKSALRTSALPSNSQTAICKHFSLLRICRATDLPIFRTRVILFDNTRTKMMMTIRS